MELHILRKFFFFSLWKSAFRPSRTGSSVPSGIQVPVRRSDVNSNIITGYTPLYPSRGLPLLLFSASYSLTTRHNRHVWISCSGHTEYLWSHLHRVTCQLSVRLL